MTLARNEFYWGIIVASLAYLLKNFVFDQILEFQKVKGRIRNRLRYYANIICSSGMDEGLIEEAQSEMRQASCDLEEKYFAIFVLVRVRGLRLLFALPSKKNISESSARLIYLSNSAGSKVSRIEYNEMAIDKIEKLLLRGNFSKAGDIIGRFFKRKEQDS